jgi:hypothetical protein
MVQLNSTMPQYIDARIHIFHHTILHNTFLCLYFSNLSPSPLSSSKEFLSKALPISSSIFLATSISLLTKLILIRRSFPIVKIANFWANTVRNEKQDIFTQNRQESYKNNLNQN